MNGNPAALSPSGSAVGSVVTAVPNQLERVGAALHHEIPLGGTQDRLVVQRLKRHIRSLAQAKEALCDCGFLTAFGS